MSQNSKIRENCLKVEEPKGTKMPKKSGVMRQPLNVKHKPLKD